VAWGGLYQTLEEDGGSPLMILQTTYNSKQQFRVPN
jgi:hypothetical protein